LNSGSSEGAVMAWRKATVLPLAFTPPTPSTPMTNGIFGALKSLRTSRMKSASHSPYFE